MRCGISEKKVLGEKRRGKCDDRDARGMMMEEVKGNVGNLWYGNRNPKSRMVEEVKKKRKERNSPPHQ